MKRATTLLVLGVCLTVGTLDVMPTGAAAPEAMVTDKETLSYGVGLYLGRDIRDGLKLDGVDVNMEAVIKGFADGLLDRPSALSENEVEEVLQAVHREMQARMHYVKRWKIG